MSLRKAIEVVAKLAESGAIHRYAIAGAFAAMNYIAPTLSDDLDILISIEDFESRQSGLILLAPVEKALAELGYSDRTDLGIMAIAIKAGRLKDLARVQSFLEQRAVDLFLLKKALQKHRLMHDWRRFCVKAGIENPLAAI